MRIPLVLILTAGISTASSIDYVTTNSSIFFGGVGNNYDSNAGLSQHVGSCFLGPNPAITGPCASLATTASNTLGLTSASVQITNGFGYDPQNGVAGFGSASSAANLATGILGVSADGGACAPVNPLCSDEGAGMAEMQDAVTFTNNSGQTANILVTWSFDGTIASTATAPGAADYALTSDFCLAPGSTCAFGGNSNEFQFQDADGPITNTTPTAGWVGFTVIPGANADSETFQGVFAVPTGTSTDNLLASLSLSCTMADCDFSHTGALSIGALPNGVSYTSASGVLLTDTSGVPEPASVWLVLAGGTLTFLRRRRQHKPISN